MCFELKVKELIIDYELALKDRKRFLNDLENNPDEKKHYLLYVVRKEVEMIEEFIEKLKR